MITIGADPELFLTENGIPVSAHALIPGTKENPHRVDSGAVQVDGMALEFNIEPAIHPQDFVFNINTVLNTLRNMVPNTLEFSTASAVNFDPEYMIDQPIEAVMLGCDPDRCAWDNQINPAPEAENPFLRTAAGHVHIGFDMNNIAPMSEEHNEKAVKIVKECDVLLGLPSIYEDPDGAERRQLYGRAGAYRLKPYGVEYRVLSNYWISSRHFIESIFNRAFNAARNEEHGLLIHEVCAQEFPDLLIEDIINTNDIQSARRIVERFDIHVQA